MIKRKIIGPKQTSVHKELLVKKKPVAQKRILVQKIFGQKKFWSKNNFGLKTILVQKSKWWSKTKILVRTTY